MNEKEILEKFLSLPLSSSAGVFGEFLALNRDNMIYRIKSGSKKNFLYIPGTRKDRVIFVAHADTVWDSEYKEFRNDNGKKYQHKIKFEDGLYKGENQDCGIGADDRAGCAMLYLLKDTGHSLLITDGEEHKQIGANHIKEKYNQIFSEINSHSYIIQLDRRNAGDYKTYSLPVSDEFRSFIADSTGYTDAGYKARTDIIVLCEKICGVNLSVGYYNEHTGQEYLCYDEWLNTLNIVRKFTSGEQKKFMLLNQ